MALISLGSNSLSIENEWVRFNPVKVDEKSQYLLIIKTASQSPNFIYSYFVIRSYTSFTGFGEGIILTRQKLYYEVFNQYWIFDTPPGLDKTKDTFFEVRRFSFYPRTTTLANVVITVQFETNKLK